VRLSTRVPALFLLLAVSVPRADAAAQRGSTAGPPRIELRLPTATTPALVAVQGVLSERAFDELLRNGFPARLHIRAELWTIGRWFDEIVDRRDWDMIVRYDVLDRTYEVVRITPERIASLGVFTRFADARAATEVAFPTGLASPVRGRKNYYSAKVEVQTIEMGDLDEVQRWLRGEVRPAVRGRRNPGTALSRGFRTLVSRLLGGETRHLEQRSVVFDF
jgi:hypothetical protein